MPFLMTHCLNILQTAIRTYMRLLQVSYNDIIITATVRLRKLGNYAGLSNNYVIIIKYLISLNNQRDKNYLR